MSRFKFFKNVLLLTFCLQSLGCQSGVVSIQNAKEEAKPFFKAQPTGEPFADRQGTTPSRVLSGNNTVFFVSIVINPRASSTAIGLNFLSASARIANPFGFHLASPRFIDEFSWAPVVVEDMSQISWIALPHGANKSHLKILDPGTLSTLDRGEVFNAINWSISSDAEWVAGIGEDGGSMLQNMTSGIVLPFFEKNLSKGAKSFQLSSRKEVAILDPLAHRVDLFSLFEPGKVIKSWESSLFAASPLGGHLIIGDAHGIRIVETDSGNVIPLLDDMVNLRFPQWKNEEVLAFISGPLSQPQLQVLDVKTGQLQPITFLSVRDQEELLICPAWVKNDLFYADRTGESSWGIWKVDDPVSSPPISRLFIQSHDSGKGYVCPKGNRG